MIMVSDIFNKPKIKIFPDSGTGKFYNNCKTREIEVKEAVSMTARSFNCHVIKFRDNKNKLKRWEQEKVRSCASNLGNYLEYLLEELDKTKIEEYCKDAEVLGDKFIPFLPDIILLMINSFQGAVETDLHWVSDLTIADSIDISIGDFDFNKLQNYLPARIDEIRKMSQELKEIDYVNQRIDSINEAILCHETKHQKASNVLLLTIIEGLVRSLGIYLAGKQGLQADPLDKRQYASLEKFLIKIPWKTDIQITGIKHGLLTGNYSSYKDEVQELVLSNLRERLGFLCRRFKENRNVILHGEETHYANALNSFLNFSALKEVLLTIKEYRAVYNNPE
jgi:hypothetical protein